MAIRNVKKNLVGMEDLLANGVGTTEQVRGESAFVMGRIDVPYSVNSVAAMQALDVTRFGNARVYSSAVAFIDYRYDAADVSGITPISGSGTWIVANPIAATVAIMKTLNLLPGDRATTTGYYNGWGAVLKPEGGALYSIATLAEVRAEKAARSHVGAATWVPDEYGDHTLDNGNIAMVDTTNGVNAMEFGASPNATASVNALAIQASLDYFPTIGTVIVQAKWLLPDNEYAVDNSLTFPKTATPEAQRCNIEFQGRLTPTDNTKAAIIFNKLFECTVRTPAIVSPVDTASGWADAGIGVHFAHQHSYCNVTVGSIRGAFLYGVKFHTDHFYEYTDYTVNAIYGPKISMSFTGDGGNVSSYFSANRIYGGKFNNSYFSTSDGSKSLEFTTKVTGLSLYAPSFADASTIVDITGTSGVHMYSPYFDTGNFDITGQFSAASNILWIHGAGTAFEDCIWEIDQLARSNRFMNTGKFGSTKTTERFDEFGYAITVSAAKDLDYLYRTLYSYTTNTLSSIDPHGVEQQLNKQHETGLSAPVLGTFKKGAIAWNTTTIATGNTTGFMCKTRGTAGTLNGGSTTGNITISTALLTVSSVAGLVIGQQLTVAGAGLTGITLLSINGLVVTLSGNATSTVSGAAVSFENPTWQALPDFP